jgi:hypothetical protein
MGTIQERLSSPIHTLQFRYEKENKMSKLGKSFVLIVIVGFLLASCTSQPVDSPAPVSPQGNNPFAPQSGDETMARGDAEIVSASVLAAESFPPQISLSLAYRLTTPCHQLRVSISQPDSQNRIHLEIYGVAPKDKPCNLMALITPQEARFSLGSFPTGHYTIWVNGVQIGAFDA